MPTARDAGAEPADVLVAGWADLPASLLGDFAAGRAPPLVAIDLPAPVLLADARLADLAATPPMVRLLDFAPAVFPTALRVVFVDLVVAGCPVPVLRAAVFAVLRPAGVALATRLPVGRPPAVLRAAAPDACFEAAVFAAGVLAAALVAVAFFAVALFVLALVAVAFFADALVAVAFFAAGLLTPVFLLADLRGLLVAMRLSRRLIAPPCSGSDLDTTSGMQER